ncbi:MAG: prepilin-type N-terminal cleavage/methylation domain-containing protein [Planctomycetota bacterium]
MARPKDSAHRADAGFTLLEALVAVAILAMVIIPFLSMRTRAIEDSADARGWRVAREIAERYLSEIQAGARESPPTNRLSVDVEGYPGFSYKVLIGEAAISEEQTALAGTDSFRGGSSEGDRLAWQKDRQQLREAQSRGLSMTDYQDSLHEKEMQERIPSEDEFEDVAVLVQFPASRSSDDESKSTLTFMLRAKICTMALEGLTPEKAEDVAKARGGSSGSSGSTGSSGSGSTGKTSGKN